MSRPCDLLVAILLMAPTPLMIGAELSLPNPVSGPGSSLSASAVFAPGADAVSGIQFDVLYDSSIVNIVATAGDAARAAGKSIYYYDLSPNQRRFLLAGMNQNPIQGGALINLFLNLSPSAPAGSYPLAISNLVGTDASGSAVPLNGISGGISIQGGSGDPIQASGVLNAASLTSGPVSPGEIVTLIGSGIGPATATYPGSSATNTVLSATSVLFDGNPAPLLLAGPDQINAIVPYEISGQNSTQLFIMNGGRLVGEVPLSVAAATPAIFTLDSSGAGPGAILNQDSSVNSPSNPAIRGSEVVLFATGAGVMNPTPVDGQVTGNSPPLPSLPVSVQIGGAAAQVVYAGAAPGLVAGVLQVNCVVPQQGITPSDSAPVVLMVGTAASPLGVVMAIQ